MQITLVPRRPKTVIPSRFIPMPQKPGSMFNVIGRWYYVDLSQSARRIPDAIAKHLKKVRLARKAARLFVGIVKVLLMGVAGVALAIYVISPLLHRVIAGLR